MTAKRDSRTRRAPMRARTHSKSDLTAEAVVTILEARPAPGDSTGIESAQRRELIAAEAYLIAERRGFAPGREFDDWIEAELAIDARLRDSHAA